MIRKVLTVFFFALLMSHLFMVTSSAEEIVASIVKEEETMYPEIEADNDELFAAYVDQLFNPRFRFPRPISGTNNQIVYNYLKAEIDEIAAGTRESTIITIPLSAFGLSTEEGFTASELGVAAIVEGSSITNAAKNAMYDKIAFEFGKVMNYLFAVCPYELYWCDKTIGYGCTYADDLRIEASYDSEVGWKLYFKQADANAYKVTFRVSADYMKEGSEDNTTADTAKTGAASNALKNAQKVLSDNDAKTDLKKLESYRDYIRSQVKYNYTAANDDSTPYGNPWQMIWVFDGDPNTNVVCEGYSKAFQYLCDKSRFNNATIDCDTVTGIMTGRTNSGRHMWNLITIDGLHYLTDITNTFTGNDGIWSLFLDGATSGDLTNGYMVAGLSYEYDAKTKETYDDDALEISPSSYYTVRQSGVEAVSALIGKIGEVEYTKACKGRIDEAREAYDALADDQKQNVGNYNVLTEAEARYAELEAAAATVDYRRASADDNGSVTYSSDTAYSCISVTDSTTEWTDGSWYVVNGNETVSNRIIVTGTANLILRDGAVLRAEKGITAAGTSTLNIFGQEAGTGKLIADTVGKDAAIGGDEGTVSGGDIVIHGGVIKASSGNNGTAAIGGAYLGDGCNLTILGGSITAASDGSGAGIGGGQSAAGGNIVIYDGSVEASSYAGAGIGGGIYGNGGNLIIYGGNVTGTSSTGVGFGGDLSGGSGSVAIRGGEVTAIGDTRAIYADTITNDMTGTGWTDTAGSTGRTRIAKNTDTIDIKDFKKIQFPAVVVPVSGISLNKSETTLVVGGTETLEASIDPADADQTVTWVSSNSDSVTVMDGTITAVKAGEASITATATNGTMDTTDDKTATCVVTVKKAKLSNLAVSIDNWTYGSTASTPVVTGNTGNGAVTFEYKVNGADDSTYTTDVPVNAGNYTIRASVAESEQYEKGVAAVDFTINMAAGTISYMETAVSKTYGDNAFTNMLTNNGDGTVTYASDHAEVAAVDAQTGEVTIAGVGDSVITATVADGTNYSYETKTASFTIHVSAATMNVSAEGYTGTYNGASHGITVTPPQGATVKYGTEEGSCTLDSSPMYSDAGTYIIYYQVTKQNYVTVTGSAAVMINAADPVRPADLTAVYGQTLGDVSLPDGWTWVDSTISVGDVGTNTFKADYNATSANYNSDSNVDVTVTVSAATENTVTVMMDGWTYGEAAKTPSCTATFGADTVTYSYSDAEKGSYTETIPGTAGIWYVKASIAGTDNYPAGEAVTSFTIARADIIVTPPAAKTELVYTGKVQALMTTGITEHGTFYYAIGDTIPEDFAWKNTVPTEKTAGDYAVWWKLDGGENYNSIEPEKLEAKINQLPLTVSAKDQTITYGGSISTDANQYTVNATLPQSDVLTVTLIADMSEKTITPSVIIESDGESVMANYDLKINIGSLTVNPATLTITPEAGQTKVYGAADPTFIYSVSGLVNGDKESVVTGALARTEGNNVGAYEYATGTLAAENYTITLGGDAKFTITPRSLTDAIVTLDHDSLVYNETEQTVSVTGVVYEDEPEKAVPSDAYTVSGNKGTNKGTYTVVITAVAGSNYKDSVQKIWKITDKPMNVSALDVPVVYDGQPHSISVRVTDPSEGAQILYGESEDSCSSETKPTITNVNESPKTIWYKVSAENYEDYYGFATVTINPKSITSISGLKAVDKVYDGTVAGTIDDSSATYAGKISGDTLSVTGDAAFNDANAGENKSVTFTNLSLKGDCAGNYTLASASATGTGKITKAVPTVTAPTAISGLVYTGSLQTLAEAGATTGGELQYAVSMDAAAPEDGWSTVIPSAANTGTYYVWYKVVGGTNYRDVAPAHVTANINPVDKSALNNTITEAETYYNSIKNDYAEVADILYNTIENAKQIGNQSNVTAADVSAAIEAINTAKAAAEAEVSTAEAVAAAISSVNAVDPSKYIQSDQQKVAEAKNTAIAAINAALTQEAVNEALAAFNHTIGNCKTEAEKREEESKQEEKQEEKKEEKQEETQKETLEEKKDPIPAPDPVLGTQKTLEANAKSISENGDPKGSDFSLLQMAAKKITKTSIRIGWKAVPKAAGYVVYGAPCGAKYGKLKEVKGTSFTQDKLKKGKYYKYFVAAYDKNGNILAASRTIHVATSGGKKGNPKSVKLNKKKVTLKKGKTFKLKAKQKRGKLKVAKHRKVAFETDNKNVATVSSSGKIKAVGAGTCNIYAYTQDGKFAKCKVTVKK